MVAHLQPRAAQAAFQLLRWGSRWPGNAIAAGQGHRGDVIQPVNADHFLDDIRRARDVWPPARDGDCPVRGNRKAQRLEYALLLGLWNGNPPSRSASTGS